MDLLTERYLIFLLLFSVLIWSEKLKNYEYSQKNCLDWVFHNVTLKTVPWKFVKTLYFPLPFKHVSEHLSVKVTGECFHYNCNQSRIEILPLNFKKLGFWKLQYYYCNITICNIFIIIIIIINTSITVFWTIKILIHFYITFMLLLLSLTFGTDITFFMITNMLLSLLSLSL